MDRRQPSFARDLAFFIALLATALAMAAAVSHALSLPNKIGMTREDYFIAQRSYDGWAQLAYVLLIQFMAIVSVGLLHRDERAVLWWSVAAVACLAASQIVFWVFTFPANRATKNWTFSPENWEALRQQWEYSHLAGALFQTLAMCALIAAVLARSNMPRVNKL